MSIPIMKAFATAAGILCTAFPAAAFDFAATVEGGTTLYFDITEDNTVTIVPYNDGIPDAMSGSIVIPTTVIYRGVEYPVAAIGRHAFMNADALTAIEIPETVTEIGQAAFFACSSLNKVELPETLLRIGAHAFAWCSALPEIAIGDAVEEIGNYAFAGCSALEKITVSASNPAYKSEDGVLYTADGLALLAYPAGGHTAFNLPYGTETIAEGAFYECTALEAISIPESVSEIQSNAFYFCGSLADVTIPENVTAIGTSAFGECSQLAAIKTAAANPVCLVDSGALYTYQGEVLAQYPGDGQSSYTPLASTREIASEAFFRNMNISSLSLPYGTSTIGDAAFAECWNLSSVVLPLSVESIGTAAFALCEGMRSIYVANDNPEAIALGDDVFYGINYLGCVLYVPEGSQEAFALAPQWQDFSQIRTYDAPRTQEISWDQEIGGEYADNTVALEAQASSGLPITYAVIEGEEIASIDGAILTVHATGAVTVVASQSGNSAYYPAASVSRTFQLELCGLADAIAPDISVSGAAGVIKVNGARHDDIVDVHTPDGVNIYHGKAKTILVQPGRIYIVTVAGTIHKIAVN